jgi:hypothetical protein
MSMPETMAGFYLFVKEQDKQGLSLSRLRWTIWWEAIIRFG